MLYKSSTITTAVTIPGGSGQKRLQTSPVRNRQRRLAARAGQGSNEYRPARSEFVSGHWPQGSLSKGSWHAAGVTEGLQQALFPKYRPMWKLAAFYPPASALPRHPPLARGALVRYFDYYRSNDTGWVREVTSRRKLPCALSAGIARGSRPVGAGTAKP